MHILQEIFLALWFFAPAGIANVMPIFTARIPAFKRFDTPMDFGRTFHGKRIFGSHKTWRGLISGIVFGTLFLALQQLAVAHSGWLQDVTSQIDYASLPTLILGPLFAIGALGGDAIESFFKRQRGIAPGKGWFPFDQTDYIIGGAIATMPFVTLSLMQYTILIVLWLAVHVASTALGYYIGVKDSPI